MRKLAKLEQFVRKRRTERRRKRLAGLLHPESHLKKSRLDTLDVEVAKELEDLLQHRKELKEDSKKDPALKVSLRELESEIQKLLIDNIEDSNRRQLVFDLDSLKISNVKEKVNNSLPPDEKGKTIVDRKRESALNRVRENIDLLQEYGIDSTTLDSLEEIYLDYLETSDDSYLNEMKSTFQSLGKSVLPRLEKGYNGKKIDIANVGILLDSLKGSKEEKNYLDKKVNLWYEIAPKKKVNYRRKNLSRSQFYPAGVEFPENPTWEQTKDTEFLEFLRRQAKTKEGLTEEETAVLNRLEEEGTGTIVDDVDRFKQLFLPEIRRLETYRKKLKGRERELKRLERTPSPGKSTRAEQQIEATKLSNDQRAYEKRETKLTLELRRLFQDPDLTFYDLSSFKIEHEYDSEIDKVFDSVHYRTRPPNSRERALSPILSKEDYSFLKELLDPRTYSNVGPERFVDYLGPQLKSYYNVYSKRLADIPVPENLSPYEVQREIESTLLGIDTVIKNELSTTKKVLVQKGGKTFLEETRVDGLSGIGQDSLNSDELIAAKEIISNYFSRFQKIYVENLRILAEKKGWDADSGESEDSSPNLSSGIRSNSLRETYITLLGQLARIPYEFKNHMLIDQGEFASVLVDTQKWIDEKINESIIKTVNNLTDEQFEEGPESNVRMRFVQREKMEEIFESGAREIKKYIESLDLDNQETLENKLGLGLEYYEKLIEKLLIVSSGATEESTQKKEDEDEDEDENEDRKTLNESNTREIYEKYKKEIDQDIKLNFLRKEEYQARGIKAFESKSEKAKAQKVIGEYFHELDEKYVRQARAAARAQIVTRDRSKKLELLRNTRTKEMDIRRNNYKDLLLKLLVTEIEKKADRTWKLQLKDESEQVAFEEIGSKLEEELRLREEERVRRLEERKNKDLEKKNKTPDYKHSGVTTNYKIPEVLDPLVARNALEVTLQKFRELHYESYYKKYSKSISQIVDVDGKNEIIKLDILFPEMVYREIAKNRTTKGELIALFEKNYLKIVKRTQATLDRENSPETPKILKKPKILKIKRTRDGEVWDDERQEIEDEFAPVKGETIEQKESRLREKSARLEEKRERDERDERTVYDEGNSTIRTKKLTEKEKDKIEEVARREEGGVNTTEFSIPDEMASASAIEERHRDEFYEYQDQDKDDYVEDEDKDLYNNDDVVRSITRSAREAHLRYTLSSLREKLRTAQTTRDLVVPYRAVLNALNTEESRERITEDMLKVHAKNTQKTTRQVVSCFSNTMNSLGIKVRTLTLEYEISE